MNGKKVMVARMLGWLVALLASGGAFMLYTQPDFMVQLSNQVWACF